jgi:hypothetical protein
MVEQHFNPEKISYLTFRLFPILLPMYFIISSIFSQDIKGVIYLAGLLFTCLISFMTGNMNHFSDLPQDADPKCYQVSLGDSKSLSNIPLSQTIYAYTFFYLIYIIGSKNSQHLWRRNWFTVIFLATIMFSDMVWNYINHCYKTLGIFISFFIGSVCGVLWGYIISASGAVNLQYFNGLSNEIVCNNE